MSPPGLEEAAHLPAPAAISPHLPAPAAISPHLPAPAAISPHLPAQAALESERRFFESHPRYSPLAATLGVPYLASKLNQMLLQHIRSCLPELRAKAAAALQP